MLSVSCQKKQRMDFPALQFKHVQACKRFLHIAPARVSARRRAPLPQQTEACAGARRQSHSSQCLCSVPPCAPLHLGPLRQQQAAQTDASQRQVSYARLCLGGRLTLAWHKCHAQICAVPAHERWVMGWAQRTRWKQSSGCG